MSLRKRKRRQTSQPCSWSLHDPSKGCASAPGKSGTTNSPEPALTNLEQVAFVPAGKYMSIRVTSCSFALKAVGKNSYPKWIPSKWKHGPRPAALWFKFDPSQHRGRASLDTPFSISPLAGGAASFRVRCASEVIWALVGGPGVRDGTIHSRIWFSSCHCFGLRPHVFSGLQVDACLT